MSFTRGSADYTPTCGIRPRVQIGPRSEFIPDVLVTRADVSSQDRGWVLPAEVLLAVEIVSPGSHMNDRMIKPQA